jgi:hypothetical protein
MVSRIVPLVATMMCLTAFVPAGITRANPPTDHEEPSCSFTLSLPYVIQVSGANMVTATLTPYPCTGLMGPNEQTVCVSAKSIGVAGQCKSVSTPSTAQVYVAPYRPGVTYMSNGKGCAAVYDRADPAAQGSSVCKTIGPYTATL